MSTRAARLTVTIKLTVGKDDDLIDWWKSIPKGTGQPHIKSILRDSIQRGQLQEDKLARIGQDTAWLCTALSGLPVQLEQVLARFTSVQGESPPTVKSTRTGELSTEGVRRRENRIAKATW